MLFGKQMTPMMRAQDISGCHHIQIKNNIDYQNFLKNMHRSQKVAEL